MFALRPICRISRRFGDYRTDGYFCKSQPGEETHGIQRGRKKHHGVKSKGIILAGGEGTRLHPLTLTVNKHLLTVGDRPMIVYPCRTLRELGIDEIMIVSGARWVSQLREAALSDSPSDMITVETAVQHRSDGIVGALRIAREFAEGCPIAVILGDNLFQSVPKEARAFFANPQGAMIFLATVADASEFGVATLVDGKVTSIVEKSPTPSSNSIVTGLYLYDSTAFARIENINPSQRGEYEITDLNNSYLRDGALRHAFVESSWLDCGTHDSLKRAHELLT